MTAVPVTPAVELRFHPTDLDAEALRTALRPLGSPSQAIEAGLMTARMMVLTQAKAEVAAMSGEITAARLIGAADVAWQLYAPKLVKSLGPAFAEEYLRSMRAAGAGDIPMATVYALAEQHASRVGTYYHESSRDALVDGFNTFVNRRIAERVAADRVLDGYGLTARGMAGLTTRSMDKAATVTPLKLKQRVLDYIGTSVRRRSRLFATQEAHNISQQAQQIAWMWLQDNGKISPNSQKIWITARDERVCPQCGPMHGVKVLLSNRFRLPNGTEVYVPGMHPNCRCEVRLLSHPWMGETSKRLHPFGKAETWNPKEHPRGGDPENPGRFSAKARSAPRPEPIPVAEREAEDMSALQRFLDQAEHQARLEAVLDAPVEPKAALAPLETKATLSPVQGKASLAPVSLGEKAVLGTPEKAQLGQVTEAKATLATPAAERAKLRMSPQERHWMEQDTIAAFLAYDEAARRKPRAPEPNKRKRRKTILLTDEQGNPQPVYYIAGPWEFDQTDRIELHDEMEFMTNGEQAAYMAGQEFDQNINDTAERIVDNAENKITQTFGDGRKFEATIEENDVYDVVGWSAYSEQKDEEVYASDGTFTVLWKEVDSEDNVIEDGEQYSDTVNYSSVAEEWHLDPSLFEVKVLVLSEGHKSERGDTNQVNFKSRHGYDSWVATGQYKMRETNQVKVGYSLPVMFVELEPEDPVIVEEDEPGVGWSE